MIKMGYNKSPFEQEKKLPTKGRCISTALKPGGSDVLSNGHPVLQDDNSGENFISLYETVYKYGFITK